MSYNYVLDSFFSLWYINLGILAVLMLVFYFIKRKYLFFYTSTSKFLGGLSFYGAIFLWLITYFLLNPMYIGFGLPAGVDGMISKDGKIYIVDYILTGGSRVSGPSQCSRVHILDAESGNKIRRIPIGEHAALYGVNGDSLILYGEDLLKIYSASKGKLIADLNRKTLPKIFPELSSGIENVMVSYSEKMLELTTQDGKHYNLSMQTAALTPEIKDNARREFPKDKKMYIHNDNEIKTNEEPGGRVIFQLQGTGGKQEEKYLKNRKGTVVSELKFLMGEFIALSESQECFVVLSFETTKKIGFILTGVSLDGKAKLWELSQSTLRPDDDREYELPICRTLNENSDVLYFGMKNEVIAIEMLTGNILWRQKL